MDFHIHVAPDPFKERVGDVYDLALQAKGVGMRGIVIKSIDYPTAPLAQLTQRFVEGIEIIGSLTFNYGVGGINPHAVEASAKLGAKVLWMPTNSSAHERREQGLTGGIYILDDKGTVLPEVKEVLALVKEFDLALCTGHLSKGEIVALFKESVNMGVRKFVVSHPLLKLTLLDLATQKELAEGGAYIEHCFVTTLALKGRIEPSKIAEAIRYVGVERCLLSTDLGQIHNPPPTEGMRMMLASLMLCGLSEEELTVLVKENPCRLLNL